MASDKSIVLYAGTYNEVEPALKDLEAFEQLRGDELIGGYDAAVVDIENGKPHIVKRVDHPRIRAIPELFGGGRLPRSEVEKAAQELSPDEVGLIVVGEPTIAKGVAKAVTHAAKTARHEFVETADAADKALTKAFKS